MHIKDLSINLSYCNQILREFSAEEFLKIFVDMYLKFTDLSMVNGDKKEHEAKIENL